MATSTKDCQWLSAVEEKKKKKEREKKIKKNASSLLMYSKRETRGLLLPECFPVLRTGKRGDRSREMISATDT